ncbi:MAG: beta-lactamase family protein [Oscillospiraceae bacterium]|nr:beta-lactamase family protein [Oscillospiraceae bacterium]
MKFEQVRQVLDSFVREGIPGVDCIITIDHQEVFRYFTGFADREKERKMDGSELYLIFSMTKMLTCTCVLQLYEQGKFQLNDPISKYLPAFSAMQLTQQALDVEAGARVATGHSAGEQTAATRDASAKNPITVKDLLTMTAGLDYNLYAPGIRTAIEQGKTTTQELVEAMAQTVLGFEPGTRFRYSLCHDVLGALVEKWSQMSLGAYMHDHIFAPLGMNDTFFGMPKEEKRRSALAQLYRFDGEGKVQLTDLNNPYTLTERYESGGAGLTSTAADYALFLDALACGGVSKNGYRLLQPDSVALMSQNHLTGQALKDFHALHEGYGYGFGVRTHMDSAQSGSLSPLGEFGWDGAAGAFSLVDRENRLSVSYFQHVLDTGYSFQRRLRNALYSDIKECNP